MRRREPPGRANAFKQAIQAGSPQLGIWLTLGAPTSTEIAASTGFDWLLFDMEHTALNLSDLLAHLRIAAAWNTEPVVRVPWNDTVVIKRVLDLGARTIMVPFVQNVDEALRAAAAVRYPPHGVRGYSGMTRASAWGADPDYARTASDGICLIVQIETPEAVAAIDEIAGVDGVDAIFVGPNDLAANMGLIGESSSDVVRTRVHAALEASRAAGKPAGTLDYDTDRARHWLRAGARLVAVGGDTSLLASSIRGLAAQLTGLKADGGK